MTVDFLSATADGKQVKAGTVWLEDGQIRHSAAPGEESLMTNLLDETYMVEGKELSAKSTPEEWLAALPRIFSGTYLRAQAHPDRDGASDSRRSRLHRALDRLLIRKRD
jgi:hypothetical protein